MAWSLHYRAGNSSHTLKMILPYFHATLWSDAYLMSRCCWCSVITDYTFLITQKNDATRHLHTGADGMKGAVFNWQENSLLSQLKSDKLHFRRHQLKYLKFLFFLIIKLRIMNPLVTSYPIWDLRWKYSLQIFWTSVN